MKDECPPSTTRQLFSIFEPIYIFIEGERLESEIWNHMSLSLKGYVLEINQMLTSIIDESKYLGGLLQIKDF